MSEKVAFITGASSGIGAEFARQLAQQGYNLVIHGRRRELLDSLADELTKKYGCSVQIEIAELSSRAEIDRLNEVLKNTQNLEILINNAGYTTRDKFYQENTQSHIDLLTVHLTATVILTRTALDIMLAKNKGAIINVASVAGFFAAPRSAMYCATKAFLNTFSEALYLELQDTDIKIQTLCPGFTLSDFHKKLGYDPNDKCFKHFMNSNFVVRKSLKALKKSKLYCIPGFKYKLLVSASKILPKSFLHFMTLRYYSKRRAAKIGAK
jgi:short-subunit dehydrogenase